jgi:hypothetical protein
VNADKSSMGSEKRRKRNFSVMGNSVSGMEKSNRGMERSKEDKGRS